MAHEKMNVKEEKVEKKGNSNQTICQLYAIIAILTLIIIISLIRALS